MRVSERIRAGLPYLIVLVIGGFLYRTADKLDVAAPPGQVGPGAWPKLVLLLMLAAAFSGLVMNLLGRAGARGESEDALELEALLRPPERHPWLVWLAVGATFGYLLLLPVLGFFLATIGYTFDLLLLGQYRRW
ncbi:MAG: tripartite tricarboxylate transporter TctB family protein, partial [Acetobacteraceae bacterium]